MSTKILNRDLLLIVISIVVTLILAIMIIRWLAPTLLGLPPDMVLVQSSREKPPYFETIFSKEDILAKKFILQDPYTRVRAKQLFPDIGSLGPNDLLGFRNMYVPNTADIIIIGDSQTYGNNSVIWDNWPQKLQSRLPENISVYTMATGGWAAVQYYYAFLKCQIFSPSIIVVAFYSGNDALETFSFSYASDLWKEFVTDTDLSKYDAPESTFPAPVEEQWKVSFSDGVSTVFTPKLRHSSLKKHPAVDAGFGLLSKFAGEMASIAKREKIRLIFTVIPTKEYVYEKKIKKENIRMNDDYIKLITDERARIKEISGFFKSLDGAQYIDLISPLQDAALGSTPLYPQDINGHPVAAGYQVIADELHAGIRPFVIPVKNGFGVYNAYQNYSLLVYIHENDFWIVDERDIEIDTVQEITESSLQNLHYRGHIKNDELKALLNKD